MGELCFPEVEFGEHGWHGGRQVFLVVILINKLLSYMKPNGSQPIPNHSHLGISIPNLGVSLHYISRSTF